MGNPARGTVVIKGTPVHNMTDFNASPNGSSVTAQRGLTPSRTPLGFRKGQKPDFTLTWSYPVMEGVPEFDYEAMWEDEEEFDLATELDAESKLYNPVMITDIGEAWDDDGVATRSVTAMALRRKRG